MLSLPDDISFERWVDYVFDHPPGKDWWFDENDESAELWNEEACTARTLAYLTRLFSAPAFLLARFSRSQIDQGLNYIVSASCSNHMFALRDENLRVADRCACVHAMSILYRELMAPVYGNDLGHLRTCYVADRPVTACYMWWDIIPLYGGLPHPDIEELNRAVLRVFTETLTLKSEACLESVLHGCGHWHNYLLAETGSIVREFLAIRTDTSSELRRYAERAADGLVQ